MVVCVSAELVVIGTDCHKINNIDSDQLLQAVPTSRLGQKNHASASIPTAFLASRTFAASGYWPVATGHRQSHSIVGPGKEATRMARGWFRSLLISSHLEHYGKQVGELEWQRLRSELCTDCL
jgi:hypothetical protein